jgi:hypothetical protein
MKLRLQTHHVTAYSPSGMRSVVNDGGRIISVNLQSAKYGPSFVVEVGCTVEALVKAVGAKRLRKALDKLEAVR